MSFHLYDIDELYSNADGTVQFIELHVGNDSGENLWQGKTITVTQGAIVHSFQFPTNLPSSATNNTTVLIATQAFADLGIVTPNFIVPSNFLFTSGTAVVNYAGVDSVTYSSLPTDGVHSFSIPDHFSASSSSTTVSIVDSPRNFAGASGVVPLLPIASGNLGAHVVGVGQALDLTIPATAFVNVDGDTITYSAALTNPDDSLPGWLSVDSLTGALSGTAAGVGTVHVKLTATDDDGSGFQTFDLTVISGHVVTGDEGNNPLDGTAADDSITGLGGNDTLAGDTGNDTMLGGAGNDTYEVDSTGDSVVELSGQGTDTVVTSVTLPSLAANVENLTLGGSGNLDATGNSLANILTGNSGDNTFNGAGGADTMVGGAGSDTFLVDSMTDQVVEGADVGTDTVVTAITLPALAANVENLVLTGSANIGATGNGIGNSITGNDGDNLIDGGAGADTMAGGNGNDTYLVDDPDDFIALSGGGTDRVISTVSYSLAPDLDVENLTLSGAGAISGAGNDLANAIIGSGVANTLDGGLGNDTLTGDAGADTFDFSTLAGTDRVTDFVHGTDHLQFDHLAFGALVAGPLDPGGLEVTTSDLLSEASGDANTFLKYASDTGQLYYDSDGSGGAGSLTLVAVFGGSSCSVAHPALTAADIAVA